MVGAWKYWVSAARWPRNRPSHACRRRYKRASVCEMLHMIGVVVIKRQASTLGVEILVLCYAGFCLLSRLSQKTTHTTQHTKIMPASHTHPASPASPSTANQHLHESPAPEYTPSSPSYAYYPPETADPDLQPPCQNRTDPQT